LELESDAQRSFFEALASRFTLVRYDPLGTGMSDRERPPGTMTFEFELDVLEALVAELGLERTDLSGSPTAAPFRSRSRCGVRSASSDCCCLAHTRMVR
jgi:hypothetical protein